MRSTKFLLPLACLALVACSKPAEPVAKPNAAAPAATPSVAEIPAKAIAKAEAVVAEVEAKANAASVVADTTKLFNDTMAKAQSYLGDKKFDLALTTLDSLKDAVLTPEQQKLATDLRSQITKAQDLFKQGQGVKNLLGK